ncbi:hypothetical protein [Actinomadura sp. 9N215]|uniref:hypothetical protein n=1 Tax=Actinomadura sp. 9N215 TaxID=3375150 RepID=UPI003799A063
MAHVADLASPLRNEIDRRPVFEFLYRMVGAGVLCLNGFTLFARLPGSAIVSDDPPDAGFVVELFEVNANLARGGPAYAAGDSGFRMDVLARLRDDEGLDCRGTTEESICGSLFGAG